MQQELLTKTEIAEIGKHIGYEAGEEMVKRFFDKHPEQAYGSIMGREIIEKILAQPGCKGISFIPGYNDSNVRQLVLVGVDEIGRPILSYNVINVTGNIVSKEGLIADDGCLGWGGKE